MNQTSREFPILEFKTADDLRAWLVEHHATSPGIWLRIYRQNSGIESVSFEEVLDQGLCFGWSESMRRKGDEHSYLQRFTPRRTRGTTSKRNLEHAERLIQAGKMTPAGLKALGLDHDDGLQAG
ncbi:MAG: hypothetical protein JXN59_14380 [Anaerolineae bacterium]|nr:hypothetical protein [Anaerolineae bacterium]